MTSPLPYSLFLDFDGTLADIAATPGSAYVPPSTIADIQCLHTALDGALAMISGRPIPQIDAFMAPACLPAAGVHGAQRRTATGQWISIDPPGLPELTQAAREALREVPGVHVEPKPGAIALHYRGSPQSEPDCLHAAHTLVAAHAGWVIMAGKCVVELKPQGIDKGGALRAFVQEIPFVGRRPIFVGDDVTDEAGFAAITQLGGISIKVGPGLSQAEHRLPSPDSVRRWLSLWAGGLPCLDALQTAQGCSP